MVRLFFLLCFLLMALPTQAQDLKVSLQLVADGLTAPIALVVPPDETQRRFIVDQVGLIKILMPDGTMLEEPFLDIQAEMIKFNTSRNDPRGLLSLAFHPNYAENGRFFIFYTIPEEGVSHRNILAELRVSDDDPNRADLSSRRILLEIDQNTMEHAAGQLVFGPEDGYLYVSLGDDFNPRTTSQDLETLMGSILRLDVHSEQQPYGIPADNPFVGIDGLDEIYAYGFRHPWRMSFDAETSQLYVSDPAWQFRNQRVYAVTPGANYGWDLQDDPNCFDEAGALQNSCTTGPDGETFLPPVIEYGEDLGRIVIGGYMYHGTAFPEFQGRYIFGEWGVNRNNQAALFIATPTESGPWTIETLETDIPFEGDLKNVWAFGQDDAGEIYVMTMNSPVVNPKFQKGAIYKLVPAE